MRWNLPGLTLALLLALPAPGFAADSPPADTAASMAASAAPAEMAGSGIATANLLPIAASAGTANGTVLVLAMDRILPGAKESALKALLPQEARAVLNLYLLGSIRQWYFRQDRPGAVFIIEASSMDNARQLLDDLPLVKARLVSFDLIPVGPYIPLATLLQHEPTRRARKH